MMTLKKLAEVLIFFKKKKKAKTKIHSLNGVRLPPNTK